MVKLFHVLAGVFVLQALLISFVTGWQLSLSLPIGIIIGFFTCKKPDIGLKLVLFLLPVSGLISNLLSPAPIISFLYIPLAAWIIGYYVHMKRNKLSFFMHPLIILFVLFLVWIIIAELRAFIYYVPDMPQWKKIIANTYS
ncbi:MAG: hypothetical protein ABII23_00505, partial [bacterium]